MIWILTVAASFALGHQWDDRVYPFIKGVFPNLWTVTKNVFAKLSGKSA
jgi:hypothetical protein